MCPSHIPTAATLYAPGISPYSAGVRAEAGYRIRRVQLWEPLPWRDGFTAIDRILDEAGRPTRALCSVELRCPEPHSFGGFGSFNDDYRRALADRDILLDGGINPVARTNVAPCRFAVPTPSCTRSVSPSRTTGEGRPSFIVSGAGDLRDQADLRPEAIVGGERPWTETGVERATTRCSPRSRRGW